MLMSFVSLSGSIGCGTGTDLNQLVNIDPFVDANPSASDEGGSFQDPFSGAPPYSAQTPTDQQHHVGMSCIESDCHGSPLGLGALNFVMGGTVYMDYKGTTDAGVPGVEVRIVDSAGHSASAYSGSEGNFYFTSATAKGVTFPAVVGARDTQGSRPMITMLTASMGSCGQTLCHVPGGGPITNTGNYYPIHVP
jgi:hypothetical protein